MKTFDTSTRSNVNKITWQRKKKKKRYVSVCELQLSSLMAWSALVMQFRELSFSCSLTHTHNLQSAFDLHSSQFSHDTYPHTPRQAHTHSPKKLPTELFSFIRGRFFKKKKRESKRKEEEGRGERREETKIENWEKKGTAATLKWDPEKNYYCWEKVKKESGEKEEGGNNDKKDKGQGYICIFKTELFSHICCIGSLVSGHPMRLKMHSEHITY